MRFGEYGDDEEEEVGKREFKDESLVDLGAERGPEVESGTLTWERA